MKIIVFVFKFIKTFTFFHKEKENFLRMVKQKIIISILIIYLMNMAQAYPMVPYPKLVTDPKQVFDQETLNGYLQYLRFYQSLYGKPR